MKIGQCILVGVASVAMAASASGEAPGPPTIGVYFDDQAVSRVGSFEGGPGQFHDAYIFVTGADQSIGGVAFSLDLHSSILITETDYLGGVNFGNPKDGVAIGFDECKSGVGGAPVMCAYLQLHTGTELITDGEIRVVVHPGEGLYISNCQGDLTDANGEVSTLSITVADVAYSWGSVKALYK